VALYTPEERDQVAERRLALLRRDERVERAELAGSGTSGYADHFAIAFGEHDVRGFLLESHVRVPRGAPSPRTGPG